MFDYLMLGLNYLRRFYKCYQYNNNFMITIISFSFSSVLVQFMFLKYEIKNNPEMYSLYTQLITYSYKGDL